MTDIDTVVEVMAAAQNQLSMGHTPALAIGAGEKWMSQHYWHDRLQAVAFETLVAKGCVEVEDRSVVFVVPIIVSDTGEDKVSYRDPRPPLTEGEREELFGLAIDANNGFDVLRCSITRDRDSLPDFGDIEIYEGSLRLSPETPGFTLLQALLDD